MNYPLKTLPIIVPAAFWLLSLSLHAQTNLAETYDGTNITGIEKIIAEIELQKNGTSEQQWRIDAQQRINKYRKSQITVEVKDKNGIPLPNAKVELKQLNHKFNFGGVISTKKFAKQAEVLPNFINQIGFNNGLKYKHKERLADTVEPIIDWAKQHDISARGHVLVYPGWQFMHKDAKKLKNNPEQLKNFIEAQLYDYAKRWDVVEWDVMNEPLDNLEIANLLGRDIMADWFKQAQKHVRNKDARLFINENRIISAPPANIDRIVEYKKIIKEIIADGGPIEAIGVQARFRVDSITPEMVYQRLEQFNEFNLPIVATEFEIVNTPRYNFKPTHLRRAQMTEEYMQVLFSHPNVDGIVAWTVLNNLTSRSSANDKSTTNEKETRGLLNWDMSLPLNGKIWLYLINNHWQTNETKQTNSAGKIDVSAFHGKYQVTVSQGDSNIVHTINIDKNTNEIALSF
ncbi:endo-1,4-beta-xylanase [Colwellia psychrerythraea]|uniref:endo-1,4-beta-xylanase n=1 Tax=Colwellia psychrerythraea (strain 34H / ATCC BAA-681) TaxID=167879 RepID=Q482D0_COLP3|nr:endo-1,4-beta-xylanase [Colwellia psychrerythraea]AAZ23981.1 glycosyl hydrolase, family 10 [Colwellia psychrerythraea 34H]